MIFVHIPKTAGEVFKRNVEAAYPAGQCVRTSFSYFEPYYDIKQKRVKSYEGVDHFKQNILSLTEQERRKIRFIGGHDSYNGIHELFSQKSKYVTFIRNPVERTISLYNFERMVWDIYSVKPVLNRLETTILKRLKDHFLIDGKVPEFEVWLDEAYDQKTPFYYSMTRYLEYLGFSDLAQFSFVGITERNEDMLYLYGELGVNRLCCDKNGSKPYIRSDQLEARVLEKIREKNQADLQLYLCIKQALPYR